MLRIAARSCVGRVGHLPLATAAQLQLVHSAAHVACVCALSAAVGPELEPGALQLEASSAGQGAHSDVYMCRHTGTAVRACAAAACDLAERVWNGELSSAAGLPQHG